MFFVFVIPRLHIQSHNVMLKSSGSDGRGLTAKVRRLTMMQMILRNGLKWYLCMSSRVGSKGRPREPQLSNAHSHHSFAIIIQVADFGLAIKIDSVGDQTHMSNMFQGTITHSEKL